IISLLFGEQFVSASNVLVVHVWATIFVGFGVVSAKWYVVEGLQRLLMIRSLLGLIINIGLNFYFIPKHGPVGAAFATIVSQVFVTLFFDLAHRKTIYMFKTKIRSILLINLKKMFNSF